MKRTVIVLMLVLAAGPLFSQGPRGKDFGFGLILGDPTGITIKYWLNNENALTGSIGGSYFGSPRIGVDYLWHFDAFRSQIVKLYAGMGGVLGIGEGSYWLYKKDKDKFYYRKDETGFGIRALAGMNIIPRRTPIELFLELGVLVGITPSFGSAVDAAVGIRFYP